MSTKEGTSISISRWPFFTFFKIFLKYSEEISIILKKVSHRWNLLQWSKFFSSSSFIFPSNFQYFQVFLKISKYFWIFPDISQYFQVFFNIFKYFSIFPSIFQYVFDCLWKVKFCCSRNVSALFFNIWFSETFKLAISALNQLQKHLKIARLNTSRRIPSGNVLISIMIGGMSIDQSLNVNEREG